MTPPANSERYKNHRFPGEIISHGVWLYYRFPLSYRDVQELLFERGSDVTHEAIRQWCLKFGQDYANQLKRRRAQPGDKWHLDEVFLTINGERHDLWRAVDQDDNVLDILVRLLLDSRGVDVTRAYHSIFASCGLLEVVIFQGPYQGFARFRRPCEPKTLESNKSLRPL
jgi:putative transposase